jgi:putrescine transport system permease protein
MPLVIFSRARLGLDPSVNAVATVIIVLVAIGIVAASWLIANAERKHQAELAAAAHG